MNIIRFPSPRKPANTHTETLSEICRRWAGHLLRLACASIAASIPFVLWIVAFSPVSLYRNDGSQPLQIRIGRHSIAVLNAHSALTTWRQVLTLHALLNRGESIFDVKDTPGLIVEARGVNIKDVGTLFSVRIDDSQVKVTLAEGAVIVSGSLLQHLLLHARQQVVVSTNNPVSKQDPEIKPISLEELHIAWAWRDVTRYTQCVTTLGLLALRFNQRSSDKIVVPDSLASLPVSAIGGLPMDDTQAVLALLMNLDPGIQVESTDDNGHRILTVSGSLRAARSPSGTPVSESICDAGY